MRLRSHLSGWIQWGKWLTATAALFLLWISLAGEGAEGAQNVPPAAATPPASAFHVYLPLVTIPGQPPTSAQLINAALAAGEIDAEMALVYKVFAGFGDDRLPARFRGDDRDVFEIPALREAARRMSALTPATQALLEPFFLPPLYEGSWFDGQHSAVAASTRLAIPKPLPQAGWANVRSGNARMRIWYLVADAGNAAIANTVARELNDAIWPRLTALFNREPLSDAGLDANGGDGLLDVYLVPLRGAYGLTVAYLPGCEIRPTFMVIDPRRSFVRSVLAHEFTHALTFTYDLAHECAEYDWLSEATGNWAMDFVYPADNVEHYWSNRYFAYYDASLERDHDDGYGAYVFPFYVTLQYPDQVVPSIWSATTSHDSLEAINRSIEGGFEERWPEFTLFNWNRPPVDVYRMMDGMEEQIVGASTVEVALQGAGDKRQELDLKEGVEHLAAAYFHFKFPDREVRTVAFYNGYTFDLTEQQVQLEDVGPVGATLVASPLPDATKRGAQLHALIKTRGHDWQAADWTGKGLVRFCRDAPAEAIEELVLIFSNSQYKDRTAAGRKTPAHLAPTLWASNVGCREWAGEVTGHQPIEGSAALSIKAQVTFRRVEASAWPLATAVDGEWLTHNTYESHGTLTWSFSGVDDAGCTWWGNDTIPIGANDAPLVVASFLISGQAHRMYMADPFLNVSFRRTCPWGPDGPRMIGTWWLPAFPYQDYAGEFLPFRVPPDGRIDDITERNTGFGVMHAAWQLQPQGQP